MAGFSELIKTFEKTRDYIRDFFIYGCKARGEFVRKSSRTYDDEKRRAESWLGDVIRYDDSVHGRQVSISVDSGHIPENPLYQAYGAKSFTDNDIRLHFLLLDLLADGQPQNLRTLTDRLSNEYAAVFDEQTVRNKLREYAAEGLLIAEMQGKTAYYRIVPETVAKLLADCPGLDEAVRFYSEDEEFGVIGAQILRSTGLRNDIFYRKHHYIVHTLEDAVLPEFLAATAEKRRVCFRTISAKTQRRPDSEGGSFEVVPMQILASVQTGRRYLAAYIPEQKRFHAFRLDFIRNVKRSVPEPDYDKLAEAYRRNLAHVFGVSFGMRHDLGAVEPVRLTIALNEYTEGYIRERLEREKRIGVLEKSGEGLYTLTVDAFDPNEVMHWAKTLIGRIVSVEGGTRQMRGRFYYDICRMRDMYGGDADDTVS
ncbi:MAG: WYL domain-containing protein [Oscillospiraceae bacterium]|nr:WYL domain-containing protein [Oscillospiraceae bacterium]MBR5362251.1 WYL domain-containing protein [Oscillospiraceae bacterium]